PRRTRRSEEGGGVGRAVLTPWPRIARAIRRARVQQLMLDLRRSWAVLLLLALFVTLIVCTIVVPAHNGAL
ncbi:MAG: hypothetical protein ABUS48_06155, partial [Pseudomonadota bacterium]